MCSPFNTFSKTCSMSKTNLACRISPLPHSQGSLLVLLSMVGHLFHNYGTIYVRFSPLYLQSFLLHDIRAFFCHVYLRFIPNRNPKPLSLLLLHFNCDFHGYLTRSRSTCIKCPSGINLLLVLKPRLFGQGYPTDIPFTVRNKKTHVYLVAGMIASIRGTKPRVYRVIILKQMADHNSLRGHEERTLEIWKRFFFFFFHFATSLCYNN